MDKNLEQLLEMYLEDFRLGRLNCAETVLITMCNYYDIDMNICPMIATPFGGGLCGTHMLCGVISGALMVIGLRHGRELGGDKAPSYELGKKLLAWFQKQRGAHECNQLIQCDFSDPEQMKRFREPGGEHETVCAPMVADVCRWLCENM